MAPRGVSGIAVGAIAIGSLLVWSGIKGTGVIASIQDLIQGHQPRALQTNAISLPTLADIGSKAAAGAAAAGKAAAGGGPTPKVSAPPTVGGGSNPLPKLPVIRPPAVAPPTSRLIAPPKTSSGAVWYKPWTWW